MIRLLVFQFSVLMTLLASPGFAGTPYMTKHGMTESQYQTETETQNENGYRLVHLDGYDVGGTAYYAAIWEQDTGRELVARHRMTSAQYQTEYKQQSKDGYRLVHLDGYAVSDTANYAAIWEKKSGPKLVVRHRLTGAQFQTENDKQNKNGYKLISVEGYGVKNTAHYAAIWEKSSGARRTARIGLTPTQYRTEFDKRVKDGYRLLYVSAYNVGNKDYYAAIWQKAGGPPWIARHKMTALLFESEFTQHYQEGHRLKSISGNLVGRSDRYTAIWEAQPDALTGEFCTKGYCFDIERFANNVEAAIKAYKNESVVKFALEARRGVAVATREYGPKRTSATMPAAEFTVNARFNSASVGKSVTAVALLQLLDVRNVGIDAEIADYLPPSWTIPESSRTVTFAELLNHSSGFRDANAVVDGNTGYQYAHVKALVANGIDADDKSACATGDMMADGTKCYQHANYALARELVASLDGFSQWSGDPGPKSSARFIKYVNEQVFAPLGIYNVQFKADAYAPTLFYPYPAGNSQGTTYGDWTLKPGSAGVYASVHELAFFTHGTFSGKLLTKAKLDELKAEELGMANFAALADGSTCWGKAGNFPAETNDGAELNSVIVGCDNGIDIALVVNGSVDLEGVVIEALDKSFIAQEEIRIRKNDPVRTRASID
jgi:CubicO group peptidase (beta-lactamase class C family)